MYVYVTYVSVCVYELTSSIRIVADDIDEVRFHSIVTFMAFKNPNPVLF